MCYYCLKIKWKNTVIISSYAALLALYYIYLSINVVKIRKAEGISLGNGSHPELERATRAHGNFIEYVPISLILLFLLEYQGLASHYMHALGGLLFISRALHGSAIRTNNLKARVLSMMMTFAILFVSSLILLLSR